MNIQQKVPDELIKKLEGIEIKKESNESKILSSDS